MSIIILNSGSSSVRGSSSSSSVSVDASAIRQWRFDESGGTSIVDDCGNSNLTQSGGTLAGGKLTLDGTASGNIFTEASGVADELDDFTIVYWFKPTATGGTTRYLQIGDNGDVTANYAFRFWESSGNFVITVVDSTNNSVNLTSAIAPTTSKTLAIIRYTRTGGAADNRVDLDVTTNGSFTNANRTTMRLFYKNASFGVRSKGATTSTTGMNGEYYKLMILNRRIADNELAGYWNAGSE